MFYQTHSLVLHTVEIFNNIGFRLEKSRTAFPVGNYMFKVNNRNTRTRCEISGVFIVNCEHISHLVLVFLLLALSR